MGSEKDEKYSRLSSEYLNYLDFLERCAFEALMDEVSATPKPGLVDRRDNGAHTDMDFNTFEVSAKAVAPYIREMAALGIEQHMRFAPDRGKTRTDGGQIAPMPREEALFLSLRPVGMEAEQAMFQATGGVNTHKGIIFSMGLAAAAAGFLAGGKWFSAEPARTGVSPADSILAAAGRMCRRPMEQEFKTIAHNGAVTHGEQLYLRYGCRGIRGEAADGFPSIRNYALPALRKAAVAAAGQPSSAQKKAPASRGFGESWNRICLQTLLVLMANVEDSNVLYRSSYKSLAYVKESARRALSLGGGFTTEGIRALEEINEDFIEKNLSPGGCADLLAITIFLWRLEQT